MRTKEITINEAEAIELAKVLREMGLDSIDLIEFLLDIERIKNIKIDWAI